MASIQIIRSTVESRIPGALTVYQRLEPEVFPTGVSILDEKTGGIPKNSLTQLCAPVGSTSGRTTLLLSLFAQATGKGHWCALVDASDCFDPESANAMDVCLSRLLWVRCGGRSVKSIEQAFKAADVLIQNGGFGVIAIDLGNVDEKLIRKIPLTTWFRFARVMESLPTALVILLPCSAAQSCANLTLHIGDATAEWTGHAVPSHGTILSNVLFNVEVGRTRMKKPVQGVRTNFSVRSKWA
jgi:hypothetical protein